MASLLSFKTSNNSKKERSYETATNTILNLFWLQFGLVHTVRGIWNWRALQSDKDRKAQNFENIYLTYALNFRYHCL